MTDILISKNNHIERSKATPKGRQGYSLATTFREVDLILIHKIPKWDRPFVEEKIGDALTHEFVHLALDAIGLRDASVKLDNVIPYVYDLRRLLNHSLPRHVRSFRRPEVKP